MLNMVQTMYYRIGQGKRQPWVGQRVHPNTRYDKLCTGKSVLDLFGYITLDDNLPRLLIMRWTVFLQRLVIKTGVHGKQTPVLLG
jgi:hypothetical protein